MNQKTIYIAGGFKSRTFVRTVMDFAERLGFIIGRDWTNSEFRNGRFDKKEATHFAHLDYRAIKASDCFLLLTDTEIRGGTLVELGIAYALDKPIYVVGSKMGSQMFYFLPGIERRGSWKVALFQMMMDGWESSGNHFGR